jgi:D-amino-acid oxidase
MTINPLITKIKIIGSGVSGLTTGITLLQNGYDVSIISKEHFKDTVSANAAAIWFPYEAHPIEKVLKWSNLSFREFEELAHNSNSGVSMVPFKIIEPVNETPYWLHALPPESKISHRSIEILDSKCNCYTYSIPLIETQIYLPFLHDTFLNNGGSIHYQEITDLEQLSENSLVINCSGLGSQELFKDKELYPIQGQTVKIEPSEGIIGLAFDELPSNTHNEITYVIPRTDCIVLGGSAFRNQYSQKIDEQLTQRIIERCTLLDPVLKSKKIISAQVGLRPGRTQIRLEKDETAFVIHNYGHGGAGFTVSWGCAAEVLMLVQKFFDDE